MLSTSRLIRFVAASVLLTPLLPESEQVASMAEHADEAGHEGLTQRADSIAETLTSIEEDLLQTNR